MTKNESLWRRTLQFVVDILGKDAPSDDIQRATIRIYEHMIDIQRAAPTNVTKDARLAVEMREHAEAERHDDGAYTRSGDLLRAGADAIERLQDCVVEPSPPLPFLTPDDVRAEALRPLPMRIAEPKAECTHAQYDSRTHGRYCPCGAQMWDAGD